MSQLASVLENCRPGDEDDCEAKDTRPWMKGKAKAPKDAKAKDAKEEGLMTLGRRPAPVTSPDDAAHKLARRVEAGEWQSFVDEISHLYPQPQHVMTCMEPKEDVVAKAIQLLGAKAQELGNAINAASLKQFGFAEARRRINANAMKTTPSKLVSLVEGIPFQEASGPMNPDVNAGYDDQPNPSADGMPEEEGASDFWVVLIDDEGMDAHVGHIAKSGKWYEAGLLDAVRNWGSKTYMSYLTPDQIIRYLQDDYRDFEVTGPFSEEEAESEAANYRPYQG